MVQVGRFLKGEKGSLFVSDEVFDFVKSFEHKDKNGIIINKVIKKLNYFADGGFVIDNINIRFEGSGVYRIEVENSGRIIGFYDNKDFIGIRSFFKKSQHLTRIQKDIIEAVKKVFINSDWVIAINK
jgi:hypothetical protein